MLCQTATRSIKLSLLWVLLSLSFGGQSWAQRVDSDGTVGTVVSGTNPFVITEGTLRFTDSILFHSFDNFSPATANVVFDLKDSQNVINTDSVSTIISRVTGSDLSFVDGQLSIVRDSNTPIPDLFLINPNGISFGENARLALPGSFIASTAQSIVFSEGAVFSANRLIDAPLLTVSTSIGLQFGTNDPGTIRLEGTGHKIATANPTFAPYFPSGANLGLAVAAGETLGLIGGDIELVGGVVSAPGGRVELGSVVEGTVDFDISSEALALDYSDVVQLGDVSLSERSLLDASGTAASTIQLQGHNIQLTEGSLLWSQNRLNQVGRSPFSGEVSVTATGQLLLSGTTPTVDAVSGIITETVGTGAASPITIDVSQLRVDSGAMVMSRSFGLGDSGRVEILASQASIDGYVAVAPNVFSTIGTTSSIIGDAGDVFVSLQDLSITDGGYLGSTTLGGGEGGDVTIEADTVEVIGATPAAIASIISATTVGKGGNSGDIMLQTRTLNLQESGLIASSSLGVGNAGDILVEASDNINISGGLLGLPSSTIASTVDFPTPTFKLLLGLSGTPRGSAGNVTVSTPALEVSDTATVTVANLAEGDAGQLTIHADSVVLRRGGIDAFTTDGEGGNITLNIQDVLLMRGESKVNAISLASGNGGNVSINSPTIVGLGNSDIVANAVTGDGGNITITTQGLLGLALSAQPTPENDISASSQFGLSGTIEIKGFTLEADAGLVELPQSMSDDGTLVAKGCAVDEGNQFIASGRGGLPQNPTVRVVDANLWSDVRPIDISVLPVGENREEIARVSSNLTEADSWQQNETGQIVLAAHDNLAYPNVTNCLTSVN